MSSLRVRVATILLSTAALACSDNSPAAPSPSGEPNYVTTAPTFTPPYTLNLTNHLGQTVASLPTGGYGEVVLWAQVSGPSGLAQTGSVTFQLCRDSTGSQKPSADCDSGAVAWVLSETVKIAQNAGCGGAIASGKGNVCRNFGYMAAPTTAGFRFRFEPDPEGGDIPAGVSPSKDMTWVAAP